jgi:ferredoxin-NADP reductase
MSRFRVAPTPGAADRDGVLTAETAIGGHSGKDVWMYMFGPTPMMDAFAKRFGRLGVPPGRVRQEEFAIR